MTPSSPSDAVFGRWPVTLTTERANPLRQWNSGRGGCSTARRPVAAATKLFLRRPVFVKRFTHEMTLPGVSAARRGRPAGLHPAERRLRPDMHERRGGPGAGPPPPEGMISGLYRPVHAAGWRRRELRDLLSSARGERALFGERAGQRQRRPLRWPCSWCCGAVRWHTRGAEWAACSGARQDAMRQGEATHDTALARGFLRPVERNV